MESVLIVENGKEIMRKSFTLLVGVIVILAAVVCVIFAPTQKTVVRQASPVVTNKVGNPPNNNVVTQSDGSVIVRDKGASFTMVQVLGKTSAPVVPKDPHLVK